jgi:hypothetical protein
LRRAAVDPVRLTDPVVLLEDPRLRPNLAAALPKEWIEENVRVRVRRR